MEIVRSILEAVFFPAARRRRYAWLAYSKDFYRSKAWAILRQRAFRKYGNACQCCGARPPAVRLNVDHIKPRSRYPRLALRLSNLQILCAACNRGKGSRFTDDWRS